MDRGLVEHSDEPAMNLCLYGFLCIFGIQYMYGKSSSSSLVSIPNDVRTEKKGKRIWRQEYDPLIIEGTLCVVLGPSTAMYRPFLKHCTLTNKAVGTICRTLSKPPQMWQGPDLCPLWFLVSTPSAIRHELASRRAEHSLPYSDVTIFIFDNII